jgi:hypothetical protein
VFAHTEREVFEFCAGAPNPPKVCAVTVRTVGPKDTVWARVRETRTTLELQAVPESREQRNQVRDDSENARTQKRSFNKSIDGSICRENQLFTRFVFFVLCLLLNAAAEILLDSKSARIDGYLPSLRPAPHIVPRRPQRSKSLATLEKPGSQLRIVGDRSDQAKLVPSCPNSRVCSTVDNFRNLPFVEAFSAAVNLPGPAYV